MAADFPLSFHFDTQAIWSQWMLLLIGAAQSPVSLNSCVLLYQYQHLSFLLERIAHS
jgi:hypothetical protein